MPPCLSSLQKRAADTRQTLCISPLFVLSSAEVQRVKLCRPWCSILQQWLAFLSWQAVYQHCLLTCFAVAQVIDTVMLHKEKSHK